MVYNFNDLIDFQTAIYSLTTPMAIECWFYKLNDKYVFDNVTAKLWKVLIIDIILIGITKNERKS